MPCGNSVGELARSWVSLQVFIQCVQGEELPDVQLAATPCYSGICDAQSWVGACCYNAAEGLLLLFCACKICSLGEKETPKSSHAQLGGCCLGHFDCSKGERGPTKTKEKKNGPCTQSFLCQLLKTPKPLTSSCTLTFAFRHHQMTMNMILFNSVFTQLSSALCKKNLF